MLYLIRIPLDFSWSNYAATSRTNPGPPQFWYFFGREIRKWDPLLNRESQRLVKCFNLARNFVVCKTDLILKCLWFLIWVVFGCLKFLGKIRSLKFLWCKPPWFLIGGFSPPNMVKKKTPEFSAKHRSFPGEVPGIWNDWSIWVVIPIYLWYGPLPGCQWPPGLLHV